MAQRVNSGDTIDKIVEVINETADAVDNLDGFATNLAQETVTEAQAATQELIDEADADFQVMLNTTEDYKDQANAARDAAFVNADVYADTAAGLAGTSVGDQFQVVVGDEIIRYRHDAGPVATEVARYPSSSLFGGIDRRVIKIESGLAEYTGTNDFVPLLTDATGRVVIGVYKSTGAVFVSGAITENSVTDFIKSYLSMNGVARFIGDGPIYPLVTDSIGRVVIGVNKDSGELEGLALQQSSTYPSSDAIQLTEPIQEKSVNHILFYGQSLSVGASAGAVISSTQPYSNITFNGGPRAWDGSTWDFGAFKPLVEDAVSPAPDGASNRAETPCSGAANYASTLLAIDGVAPSDHIVLASTAGHGGYRINQLEKGSAWYSNLIAHVTGAQALNSNHAVHALCWLQGENDISPPQQATRHTERN